MDKFFIFFLFFLVNGSSLFAAIMTQQEKAYYEETLKLARNIDQVRSNIDTQNQNMSVGIRYAAGCFVFSGYAVLTSAWYTKKASSIYYLAFYPCNQTTAIPK